MEEGRSCKTFEPISAIKKWNIDKVWRTTEEKGSRVTIYLILLEQILNHSVMMTVTMRKKIFLEMRTEKDISFLLISITIFDFLMSFREANDFSEMIIWLCTVHIKNFVSDICPTRFTLHRTY